MKILKIFGVVVGIHVFALILIFANPGCSSANKPAPSASDTVVNSGDSSSGAVGTSNAESSPISAAPTDASSVSFDPNAPATAIRFSPTRPGTPAAAAVEAQPVGDVIPATTYTVVKGDSLWTIAKKNKTTVAEIAAANNIKASAVVRLGQKLIIPGKSMQGVSVVPQPATTKPAAADVRPANHIAGEPVKHVVRPGETLGAIARKYQVKVGEIAIANNISDPAKIRPGMELTIPGWQAPSSKSAKPATTKAPSATTPATEPTPSTSVPTVILPPPEQDLDSGLRPKEGEPPVIKVEDK